MTAADADGRAARLIAAARQASPSAATWLLAGDRVADLIDALLDAAPRPGADPERILALLPPGDDARWARLRERLIARAAASAAPRWPDGLLPGIEPLPVLADGRRLALAVGDPSAMLRRLAGTFDALVFADPEALRSGSPARWQGGALARLAAPGARVVVAAGPVDTDDAPGLADALRRSGFAIETREAGEPLQATRLAASASPTARAGASAAAPHVDASSRRDALVVGAGLAGAAVAAALAARGWSVTVLEREAWPARQGSGQPQVVDHLHLSIDDNPMARLTRAGARLAAVRDWVGPVARPVGKLLLPADAAERARQAAMLARLTLPPGWARMVDATQAHALTGLHAPLGGLWLAQARIADPARQCAHWLSQPGITLRTGCAVASLRREDGHWQAIDADGTVTAAAPVAIVAAATASPALAGTPGIALEPLAGQTTMLAGGPLGALRTALGGAAYACPLGDGRVLIGSTFSDAEDFRPDAAGDADNVGRIAAALGLDVDALAATVVSRHGGVRCAARDRLPVVGAMPDETAIAAQAPRLSANDRLPLPRHPGLYGAFGLGARGLLWSVLAAEVIAARLTGEPPPLTLDLLASIDPARFARAALRREGSRDGSPPARSATLPPARSPDATTRPRRS